MTKIYSDLPNSVMQALLEEGDFEIVSEKDAEIKIYAKDLPPAPYRVGKIIDLIKNSANKLRIAEIDFDLAACIAAMNGKKIRLTEKEADILQYLHKAEKPVSREELLQSIWQYANSATTNTVETHIYRLRQKLSDNFGIEVIATKSGNYYLHA